MKALLDTNVLIDYLRDKLGLTGPRRCVGAYLLDLDAFKNLNDSLGHSAGDEMLVNVASRLGLCVRSQDSVARLGGDEFAVLLNSLDDRVEAEEIARRVLNTLADPIQIAGRAMGTSASIGIAYGRPGDTADNLLRNADLAMYVAKSEGRNRVEAGRLAS